MAGASNQAAMADMLSQQLLEAAKLVEEQVSSISSTHICTTKFKQLRINNYVVNLGAIVM